MIKSIIFFSFVVLLVSSLKSLCLALGLKIISYIFLLYLYLFPSSFYIYDHDHRSRILLSFWSSPICWKGYSSSRIAFALLSSLQSVIVSCYFWVLYFILLCIYLFSTMVLFVKVPWLLLISDRIIPPALFFLQNCHRYSRICAFPHIS